MLARAFQRLPRLLRFLACAAAFSFAALVVLRAAFWLAFRSLAGDVPASELLQAFYLGIKFDLRLALLSCLPPLVLALLPPLDPTRRPLARRLWVGYLIAAQALVLFL